MGSILYHIAQAFEWHQAFIEGCEVSKNLVIDDNIEKVKGTAFENRRIGIREIAENLNSS